MRISKITNTSYFRQKIDVRLSVCPTRVWYNSTVSTWVMSRRYLEGSILLRWVIWHMTFFFRMLSMRRYTFCLLIVWYMLSDKIKSKSALKAWTSLHVHDKGHACYWYQVSMHLLTKNSAGYLQHDQINTRSIQSVRIEFFSNGQPN